MINRVGGSVVLLPLACLLLVATADVVTTILAVLAVTVAGIAVYDIYRIGDSGSKAAWHDRVSSAPLQR